MAKWLHMLWGTVIPIFVFKHLFVFELGACTEQTDKQRERERERWTDRQTERQWDSQDP